MSIPKINTRATNVELTNEKRALISRKLTPLARFLVHDSEVHIDVVLRRVRMRLRGDMFYLSVKVTTPNNSYIAIAAERHLPKALTRARETLRRTISRGASVVDHELRRERQTKDSLTLTLEPRVEVGG